MDIKQNYYKLKPYYRKFRNLSRTKQGILVLGLLIVIMMIPTIYSSVTNKTAITGKDWWIVSVNGEQVYDRPKLAAYLDNTSSDVTIANMDYLSNKTFGKYSISGNMLSLQNFSNDSNLILEGKYRISFIGFKFGARCKLKLTSVKDPKYEIILVKQFI